MTKAAVYEKRKRRFQNLYTKLDRAFNLFVYLKLIVLGSGLPAIVTLFFLQKWAISGGLFMLGLVLFIYLDIRHRSIINSRDFTTLLKNINDQSIGRFNGLWQDFQDNGAEFRDDAHPYASDLDIFGPGSLFQWMNTTRTYLGRQKLRRILTDAPETISVIRQRQTAIAELATSLRWRQWFQAHGTAVSNQMRDPDFLFTWVNERHPFWLETPVIFTLRLLPAITISLIGIYFLTHRIPSYIPLLALIIQFGLLKIGSAKRTVILRKAGEYEKNLQIYADLIRHILNKDFQTDHLRRLKKKLYNRANKSADSQLKSLSKIVDSIANRNNAYFAIINIIMLWDYQWLIALERWKKISGEYLKDWLETVAEFEALASLATIAYDHPEWAWPVLTPGNPFVSAEKLAHPLLPEADRISNPLHIGAETSVYVITGSNMSGKSTYLRTAGINLALAYAGAPVCAASFRCTLFNIHSCMRIGDNLAKNISTFYAEILRIKSIVESSAGERPVFFLLDEVFKGTNSLDRHTGAKMLIKKLIQNGAVGLVSTHDLELGELEKELSSVKNGHFREHYHNNHLHFDYRLHPGISNTRNALYLMKAAGVVSDSEE